MRRDVDGSEVAVAFGQVDDSHVSSKSRDNVVPWLRLAGCKAPTKHRGSARLLNSCLLVVGAGIEPARPTSPTDMGTTPPCFPRGGGGKKKSRPRGNRGGR